MTTATVQLADLQHPWIGLASFTEGEREFFAGRVEEIDELLRLVRRDILTLLYGVSGLGKTSLLQAGLFPALRAEDCLPIPIRLDYLQGAAPLAAQVFGAIIAAADAAGVEAPQPRPDETLWEYLHREGNHFWSPHNDLVTPFLAFDQFEELFTLGRETPECAARTTAFISDLADLVENRPPPALRDDLLRAKEFSFKPAPLKVLLAMREDYLADLDRIRSHFRALGQNRLRLLPMGERQARQVIALGAPLLAPGVQDRILQFVAGGGDDDPEVTIAPALLSLVLRELNERRLARGPDAKITPDLLDVEQQKIFEDFYLRTIADFPVGVRTFIEDKLLTTTGYRDSCALDDALSCPDVTQPVLNELVNRRLLAYEDRHHTRRVELTHDVLIPVIKASRDTRLTREAIADAQRRIQDAKRKDRVRRAQLIFAVGFAFVCLALAGATFWALLQAHKLSDEKKSVLRSASAVKPLFSEMAMLSLEDESNTDPVLPESVTQLLSENIDRLRELSSLQQDLDNDVSMRLEANSILIDIIRQAYPLALAKCEKALAILKKAHSSGDNRFVHELLYRIKGYLLENESFMNAVGLDQNDAFVPKPISTPDKARAVTGWYAAIECYHDSEAVDPTDPYLRAITSVRIGHVYRSLSVLERDEEFLRMNKMAEDSFRQALEDLRSSIRSKPKHAAWLSIEADAYNKLGNLARDRFARSQDELSQKTALEDALRFFHNSEVFRNRLKELENDNPCWSIGLVWTEANLAEIYDIYRKLSNTAEKCDRAEEYAREYLLKRIETSKDLLRTDPGNRYFAALLRNGLLNLADFLLNGNSFTLEKDQAIEIAASTVLLDPASIPESQWEKLKRFFVNLGLIEQLQFLEIERRLTNGQSALTGGGIRYDR
jgi:hypothetical protein